MQKLKYTFIIFLTLLFTFMIICTNSISYAISTPLTEDNLNKALQDFVSSDANEDILGITMSNGEMTIKQKDGKSYTINYDLTNNPKFIYSIPIQKGMSYEEFQEKITASNLLRVCYDGAANVQGVNFKEANDYYSMWFGFRVFSAGAYNSSKYTVVPDGTTVENNDSIIIYESDFGNKVIEYVNSIASTKKTFSDSADIDGYDTITYTIEESDATSSSCNLVSTLTVNLDGNFSQFSETGDPNPGDFNEGESGLEGSITKDNADYKVTLKVGQKCRFETSEKITGHAIYSANHCTFEKVNEYCGELTGKSIGKSNGYIKMGEIKKTFYIIVEENTENKDLDSVIIQVNTTDSNNNPSKDNSTPTPKPEQTPVPTPTPKQTLKPQISNTPYKDDTTSKDTLPQTGENSIVYIIVVSSCILLLIVFGINLKKYKDIK